MAKKYLKILTLLIKNSISLKTVMFGIFEYGFYFILLNFLFKNISLFSNYSYIKINSISAIYLLTIYLYKYFLENTLIFRYLIITGNFDSFLITPINPLFRILVNKVDIVGLVTALTLSIFTLFWGYLPNLIPIIGSLVLSISVFIFVLALLLKTSGKIPFEKLLVLIFVIGLIGISGTISGPLILIASIIFLIISFRFWNLIISKYE